MLNLVVVLGAEVSDERLPLSQRSVFFSFSSLDEEVVLGVELGGIEES